MYDGRLRELPQEQCYRSCTGRSKDAQMVEPNPWWLSLPGS